MMGRGKAGRSPSLPASFDFETTFKKGEKGRGVGSKNSVPLLRKLAPGRWRRERNAAISLGKGPSFSSFSHSS